MAAPISARRMARERVELEKENSDYIVHFKDGDLMQFEAYVFGTSDTPYQYKLIKLQFEIPNRYPFVPPKVKFIQSTGERIHPNLYVEGKVCLSILGTWAGEPWAFGMTCQSVLITVRSLLDDKPYKHEPGRGDSPDYNRYVEHFSWRWLLLDYLEREIVPSFQEKLFKHMRENGAAMMTALAKQEKANATFKELRTPYKRGVFEPCYVDMRKKLEQQIKRAIASGSNSPSSIPLEADAETSTPAGAVAKRSLPDEDIQVDSSLSTPTKKQKHSGAENDPIDLND